jgi:hypothetical protein
LRGVYGPLFNSLGEAGIYPRDTSLDGLGSGIPQDRLKARRGDNVRYSSAHLTGPNNTNSFNIFHTFFSRVDRSEEWSWGICTSEIKYATISNIRPFPGVKTRE